MRRELDIFYVTDNDCPYLPASKLETFIRLFERNEYLLQMIENGWS